jgi:putative FmdB family regulatory protein
MPVYEYQCTECREVFEIFHKINEEYRDGCPKCMGQAKKILSPSNFILKGSGFYVNDYPSESRKKPEAKEKKPKESATPKVDKPEAPAEKS